MELFTADIRDTLSLMETIVNNEELQESILKLFRYNDVHQQILTDSTRTYAQLKKYFSVDNTINIPSIYEEGNTRYITAVYEVFKYIYELCMFRNNAVNRDIYDNEIRSVLTSLPKSDYMKDISIAASTYGYPEYISYRSRVISDNVDLYYKINAMRNFDGGIAPSLRDIPGFVSIDNAGNVACFRNMSDYFKGKITTMKLGRYLKLTGVYEKDEKIASIVNDYNINVNLTETLELLIAETEEEITNVYIQGPNSCMSGNKAEFDTLPTHPSAVYASPDFAVAYCKIGDRITARSVISKKRKIHSSVYGNCGLMDKILAREGYEHSYNFSDHRLQAIPTEHDDVYVMPYLDFSDAIGLSSCETFFIVDGGSGYYVSDNTSGTTGEGRSCECCEQYINGDTVYINSESIEVCYDCSEEYYVYSDYDDEYISRSDASWSDYHGDWIHDSYVVIHRGDVYDERQSGPHQEQDEEEYYDEDRDYGT